MANRTRTAKLNIYITFVCQMITIVCGFVAPRILLGAFGSEIYGASTSINQFLSYITLLEGGICGVARASLYKPLANNDNDRVNIILSEIKKFFKTLSYLFVGYVLLLAISFKTISHIEALDYISTFALVIVISISTFAQYYFGISYSVLLQAAQKTYITNITNIISVIINTIMIVILTKTGNNMIVVKLVSSVVFCIKPFILWWYANKSFKIENISSKEVILKDKWVAFGQHIAYFLHSHTDVAILTLLGNLVLVSVYSVYNMVLVAIQNLMSSFSTGMEAVFGDMYAKQEHNTLKKAFNLYETMISIVSIILFSSTSVLIVPFIKIYTDNITDADYIRPLFALLLAISSILFSLRTPYHAMIIAVGHFKQTNVAAYGETIVNVVLSIILVRKFDLVGVAIGTVAATLFRFIFYVIYLSKNVLHINIIDFIKRCFINTFIFTTVYILGSKATSFINISNYAMWAVAGIVVFVISFTITIIINLLFYKADCLTLIKKVIKNSSSQKCKNIK